MYPLHPGKSACTEIIGEKNKMSFIVQNLGTQNYTSSNTNLWSLADITELSDTWCARCSLLSVVVIMSKLPHVVEVSRQTDRGFVIFGSLAQSWSILLRTCDGCTQRLPQLRQVPTRSRSCRCSKTQNSRCAIELRSRISLVRNSAQFRHLKTYTIFST